MAPNYLNRTGFQDGTTMDLKYINPGFDKSEGIVSGMGGFPIVPVTGIGAVLALRQKDKDKRVTTETEEPKLPEQKPPEGPDIVSEIAAEVAIKKVNDDLENKATYKFQYMANKEADQTIGNKEIILKLDKEIFNKYVKKLSNVKTFEKHEKKFPDTYVKFFKRGDLPEYRITKVGQLGEDIDTEENIWNIKVKDFSSKKAIKHSKTFDSDVYPIEKAYGGLIDKPLMGGSRYI